jgi:hypothetical protein
MGLENYLKNNNLKGFFGFNAGAVRALMVVSRR